jgi:hypothetical protein
MMIRSAVFVIALALFIGRSAHAEPEQLPATEIGAESRRLLQESEATTNNILSTPSDGAPQSSASRQVWQEVGPSPATGPPAPSDVVPGTMAADIAGAPACPPSPHGSPRWEIDFAYVPTTIDFNSNDMGKAYRLDLAHEDDGGYGRRARLWVFHQQFNRWIDLNAATLSYDLYRRVQFERGEITYGWGPMALYDTSGHNSHFFAAGASIFAEGFYPLLRSERTDLGPVGSARLAALIGVGDYDGSVEFGTNTLPIIDEYSWGLELRHRFGGHQDKLFFVDVTRDLQNWGSPEIPYVTGTSFQGTAIKLGWIW